MENMNEKMMEHEMDMVDGIWMDENEATNLASCLPHYWVICKKYCFQTGNHGSSNLAILWLSRFLLHLRGFVETDDALLAGGR